MSANIVVVHNEPTFLELSAAALRLAGFDVVAFADPVEALNGIEPGQPIDAPLTRVTFPEGKPHGVPLALVLRAKYPGPKVVFAARAERSSTPRASANWCHIRLIWRSSLRRSSGPSEATGR